MEKRQFIEYRGGKFMAVEIDLRKLARQPYTIEEAHVLAETYARQYDKGGVVSSTINNTAPAMLLRYPTEFVTLEDYVFFCESGEILYNLGCVFCELTPCTRWSKEDAYNFLELAYNDLVEKNPRAWEQYAKDLVSKTQKTQARYATAPAHEVLATLQAQGARIYSPAHLTLNAQASANE